MDPEHRAKINAILPLVQQVKNSGSKVLLFSQWPRFLVSIQYKMQKLGMNLTWFDGIMPPSRKTSLLKELKTKVSSLRSNDTWIFSIPNRLLVILLRQRPLHNYDKIDDLFNVSLLNGPHQEIPRIYIVFYSNLTSKAHLNIYFSSPNVLGVTSSKRFV